MAAAFDRFDYNEDGRIPGTIETLNSCRELWNLPGVVSYWSQYFGLPNGSKIAMSIGDWNQYHRCLMIHTGSRGHEPPAPKKEYRIVFVDGGGVFSNLHGIALFFFFPMPEQPWFHHFEVFCPLESFQQPLGTSLLGEPTTGGAVATVGRCTGVWMVFFSHSTCTARLLAYMQYVCNFACMHLLFSIARTLRNSMCLIRGLGWVLKEDWQGFPKCNDQTAEIQTFKSLKWHIPVTLWTVAPQGFAELQYPAGPRRDAWLLVSGGWSLIWPPS